MALPPGRYCADDFYHRAGLKKGLDAVAQEREIGSGIFSKVSTLR